MKRHLTDDEIAYVLRDIGAVRGLNSVVADNILTTIRSDMLKDLKRIQLYPDKIDQLKQTIEKQYHTSQIQPGDSIGILTAQSIGERQTQLSLDSFHSTGITTATVVTGVPRFNELVNATKNPKSIISVIYTSEEYKCIQDIRNEVGIHIKHVTFRDVFKKYRILTDAKDKWYASFNILNPTRDTTSSKYCIRCYLDIKILYQYRIRLERICNTIEEKYNVVCVWSPQKLGIIDVWATEDGILPNLMKVTINGIEGVENINYVLQPKTNEWVIEALCTKSALPKLFASDLINARKTSSNHMWDLFKTLGVEATREFLIQEFVNIISIDSYINLRHIQLLVDVMLYTGSISSISRYGVHKNQSGALSKCSFEESLEHILNAGVFAEKECINGVSGAIICGKVSSIGTGLCDLIYSETASSSTSTTSDVTSSMDGCDCI